jgi:hypothetical protein
MTELLLANPGGPGLAFLEHAADGIRASSRLVGLL